MESEFLAIPQKFRSGWWLSVHCGRRKDAVVTCCFLADAALGTRDPTPWHSTRPGGMTRRRIQRCHPIQLFVQFDSHVRSAVISSRQNVANGGSPMDTPVMPGGPSREA